MNWLKPNSSGVRLFIPFIFVLVSLFLVFGGVRQTTTINAETGEVTNHSTGLPIAGVLVLLFVSATSYVLCMKLGGRIGDKVVFRPYLLVAWAILLIYLSAAAIVPLVVILLGIVITPALFLLSMAWPRRWTARDFKHWHWISAFVATAVIVSVLVTNWPLRIHYQLVRARLDALADSVERGEQPRMPSRVGVFKIRKAEINDRNGIICLWTVLYPGGNSGFVRTSRDHLPFNLFSAISMDNEWQYITED